MDFEKTLLQLEETVRALENKDVPLDEGVNLFEKGLQLTKACLTSLAESKGKIDIIRKEMDKLTEEPFDGE